MQALAPTATSLLAHVDQGVLRVAEDVFRAAARRIRTRLVNLTAKDVPVRLGAADVGSLGVALERLQGSPGSAFARFTIQPGGVPGLMVVSGQLLHRVVGIMLGEDDDGDSPYQRRPLTQVDLRVARRLCESVLMGILDSTNMEPRPSGRVEMVSSNSRIPLSLPTSVTVVEASFDFGAPDDPYGLMSVLVPGQAAGILWPRRVHRRSVSDVQAPNGLRRVLPVQVTAVAELTRVRLSLRQLRDLKVGDTLDLGPLRDVDMRVGGRPTLVAEAGEQDGVRSVRVKGRAD